MGMAFSKAIEVKGSIINTAHVNAISRNKQELKIYIMYENTMQQELAYNNNEVKLFERDSIALKNALLNK
jgi:hypothetical protein